MRAPILGIVLALAAELAPVSAAGAQSLAQRIAAVDSGRVQFIFASRPGVCGDGYNSFSTGDDGCSVRFSRRDDGEVRRYTEGPLRVILTIRDSRVVAVRTRVGGDLTPAEGVTDLGRVSAREASDYLLGLAERGEGRVGDDAIVPAALADSVTVWPRLLTLARNDRISRNTRRAAALWLGFAAADAVDPDHAGEEKDDDPRGHAVFALSQRPREESVPALVQIARTHRDPSIRRKAIFWLSQNPDERGLALMEEVLRTAGRNAPPGR
ncbi:MAG: HEAT repeat domain-containing protein [Gemmatimonadaceae bacterium]